jgi:hypothetical protein
MQTRHYIVTTLIIIVGLAWSGAASAGSLKNRLQSQRYRIQDGLAGGELTYREVQRLRDHQRQIRQMRQHFLADGHLSHRERQILDQRLDRNSDRIYALKHNRRFHSDRHWYGSYR